MADVRTRKSIKKTFTVRPLNICFVLEPTHVTREPLPSIKLTSDQCMLPPSGETVDVQAVKALTFVLVRVKIIEWIYESYQTWYLLVHLLRY